MGKPQNTHQKQHIKWHRVLDVLIAEWVQTVPTASLDRCSVSELMQWSYNETLKSGIAEPPFEPLTPPETEEGEVITTPKEGDMPEKWGKLHQEILNSMYLLMYGGYPNSVEARKGPRMRTLQAWYERGMRARVETAARDDAVELAERQDL